MECELCDIKRGEEQFGHTFAPSMCWCKVERRKNNALMLVFGYGEDVNDRLYHPLYYCPFCGKKQEIISVEDKQNE